MGITDVTDAQFSVTNPSHAMRDAAELRQQRTSINRQIKQRDVQALVDAEEAGMTSTQLAAAIGSSSSHVDDLKRKRRDQQ